MGVSSCLNEVNGRACYQVTLCDPIWQVTHCAVRWMESYVHFLTPNNVVDCRECWMSCYQSATQICTLPVVPSKLCLAMSGGCAGLHLVR